MSAGRPAELAPSTAIERVLRRVRPWVEHETPSGHEPQLTALALRIAAELAALGAEIEHHPAPGRGQNLTATVAGREPHAEPLLILAHLDTVHPLGTVAERPFAVTDARATGPGVYDMKTGLALFVEALALLREQGRAPRRPVTFLVTCDEEIGSNSARPHIERHARSAGAVLVPEPCLPDGGVKTARKGVATYRLKVTGRAGHAGMEPGGQGVSAIAELLDQCRAVAELARHELGTAVNIGVIHGGTATNVVAAEAWAGIDVRLATPGEPERIERALAELRPVRSGARVRAELTESRPPLLRTEPVLRLYRQARALAAELGFDLTEGSSGGGSDGSLAAHWGAPTLDGLGPKGGGAHAANEHILLEDLPFRLALHAALLERL